MDANTGAWLNVAVSAIRTNESIPEDHVVAWDQFCVISEGKSGSVLAESEKPEIEITETAVGIDLKGDNFSYFFNKLEGRFEAIKYEGMDFIYQGPRFNVWRAPVDNDMYVVKDWISKGVNNVLNRVDEVVVSRGADFTEIAVDQYISPPNGIWGIRLKQNYTVYNHGLIKLRTRTYPRGAAPETLPRIGYRLTLPVEYSKVNWHGRGPGESYVDTKSANLVGTYSKDVADMFTEYVYPQENGNRTDVKFMACAGPQGTGLFFYSREDFNFSIHKYSLEKLEAAKHTFELVEDGFLSLYIDHKHHGIGSNSCGPVPLKEHSLKPDYFDFDVYIKPFVGPDPKYHEMFGERLI